MNRTVVHVISTIERGGAETQLLILARQQSKNGNDVHLVFLKDRPELLYDFVNAGVVVYSTLAQFPLLKKVIQLRKIISSLPDPIIHAHLPLAELLTRFSLIFKSNAFVISRHNTETFLPRHPGRISSILSRWVTKRAKAVVCISQSVERFLLIKREIHQECSVYVVLYARDDSSGLESKPKKILNTLKCLNLITIGRLVDQKNYLFLFQSLSIASQQGLNFSLDVYGSGILESRLKILVRDLHLNDKIRFLGKTSDVMKVLLKSDLFVITSKYEGFGLVLLEAMQAGLPIIAPINSAFPEVLGNDYPGLYIDNAKPDFITKLNQLYSPIFYAETARKSTERLKFFDPISMAMKIDRIYEDSN